MNIVFFAPANLMASVTEILDDNQMDFETSGSKITVYNESKSQSLVEFIYDEVFSIIEPDASFNDFVKGSVH